MRVNKSKLSSDPALEPFFKRITASPVKRESVSTAITSADEVKKPRPRRQTKAREELEQL